MNWFQWIWLLLVIGNVLLFWIGLSLMVIRRELVKQNAMIRWQTQGGRITNLNG